MLLWLLQAGKEHFLQLYPDWWMFQLSSSGLYRIWCRSNGKAALLSMLQSCSVLTVVNIDAGFTAGAFAARIANLAAKIAHCNIF